MNNPIIETHGLSKWFGEVVALNNVDLSIPPGLTGVLGPNGAGKSTFIKLILGLYRPSRGTVRLLGENPRNNANTLKRIGYCPEIDAFHENLTGFEFVRSLCRHWGMGRSESSEAAAQACEIVRMTGRMHDPIDEYSKGMRQRIKIAQALASRPQLLVLDEPLTGLDPQGREEMFALIHWLGDTGHSVIVSSHVLHEVERVTDSIVLLYRGSVLAQGKIGDIRDMIDEHPHTITVESSEPRRVVRCFAEDPDLIGLDVDGAQLTLRTRDPNRCYQRLNELALEDVSLVRSIQCADGNLQAVFDYLVH